MVYEQNDDKKSYAMNFIKEALKVNDNDDKKYQRY